jgi:hypothetical protein
MYQGAVSLSKPLKPRQAKPNGAKDSFEATSPEKIRRAIPSLCWQRLSLEGLFHARVSLCVFYLLDANC